MGLDTHLETHVAAALNPIGGLLGVAEFDTTQAGLGTLFVWLNGFGPISKVGVEGTDRPPYPLCARHRSAGT